MDFLIMSKAVRQTKGERHDRQKEQFIQEHGGKKEQRSSRKCQCFVCPAFRSAGVVVAEKPERERGSEAVRASGVDSTRDRKEDSKEGNDIGRTVC